MTRSAVWLAALSAASGVSCVGRFDPAHFEGTRGARRVEPEAIAEVHSLAGLEQVGRVQAKCTARSEFFYRRLRAEPLSDVDCTAARLDWALRESAARAGGEALVGVRCASSRSGSNESRTYVVSCDAAVARVARTLPIRAPRSVLRELPAPSASDVRRIDEPDASLAFRIRIDFEPSRSHFEGLPRSAVRVRELPSLPLADFTLGDLTAHCLERCDERALRYGVLLAAGRLGAPDVVGVRCFDAAQGNTCVGTLAAPERGE